MVRSDVPNRSVPEMRGTESPEADVPTAATDDARVDLGVSPTARQESPGYPAGMYLPGIEE